MAKAAHKKKNKSERVCTQFRFLDSAHRELIGKAAKRMGVSMNSWLVQATLRQARAELGVK